MKWVNHRLVSGVLVFAATDDLLLAVCAAVIPDKVEGYPLADYKKWKARHRGWSHVPWLYLLPMAIVWQLHNDRVLPVDTTLPAYMASAFLAGAVLHIIEDALCGRVPLLYPKRKYGIRLFTVGSAGEYFFTAAVIFVVLLAKFPDFAATLQNGISPLLQ